MSTLSNAARTAARNAINALVDAGSGTYPTLRYRNAGGTALLTINLNSTKAIADAVNGVSSINAPAGEASWVNYSVLPSVAGTVADVALCDTDGTVVETFFVGITGSGDDFTLTTLNLTVDVPVIFAVVPTITQRATYDATP